jgi:hypothetical protein
MKETKSKQPAGWLHSVLVESVGARFLLSVHCRTFHPKLTVVRRSPISKVVLWRSNRSFLSDGHRVVGQQLAPVPVTFIQAADRRVQSTKVDDQLHFCSSNSGRLSLIEVCGKSDQ